MKLSSEKLLVVGVGLVIYLLSAGISYTAFSYFRPGIGASEAPTGAAKTGGGKFKAPERKYAGLPKTEECPLSGAMYSRPEREIWEKRRPLGVMVENSKAARPQSGLSSADVVYEAVAEGGITRFMAVFYCQDTDVIGPVRSARTYFLDWISEYGNFPLYAHVGGANAAGPADALGQIEQYGWGGYNDLNQFSIGFPTFWRDYDRLGKDTPTEHTVYSSTQKLWTLAALRRRLTNTGANPRTGNDQAWDDGFLPWKFKDDAATDARPASFKVSFNFSNTQSSYIDDYAAEWRYDHDSNSYLRFNGGAEHRDMDTNAQLLAKNVFLLFMPVSIANDDYNEEGHGVHLLYGNKGTGRAKFLIDGRVTDGTWAKKGRMDRTRFFDQNGVEIKLNRGLTWIEILPVGQQITLQ